MDSNNYPHPWEQDLPLTDRLLKLVDDEDWDLFGIADVGPLNEKARPGRRPKDLWPTAKAVLMFAVGLADPFTRGWVATTAIPTSPRISATDVAPASTPVPTVSSPTTATMPNAAANIATTPTTKSTPPPIPS